MAAIFGLVYKKKEYGQPPHQALGKALSQGHFQHEQQKLKKCLKKKKENFAGILNESIVMGKPILQKEMLVKCIHLHLFFPLEKKTVPWGCGLLGTFSLKSRLPDPVGSWSEAGRADQTRGGRTGEEARRTDGRMDGWMEGKGRGGRTWRRERGTGVATGGQG